jgi:UrcA family protein
MNRITLAAGAAIAAAGLLSAAAAPAAPGAPAAPAAHAAAANAAPANAAPANAAATIASDTAAASAAADAPPRVVVKYGDLDIATHDGARILYRRIVAAARRVCVAPESRDLQAMTAAYACREAAVAAAVRQVDSAKLAAEFAARSKSG